MLLYISVSLRTRQDTISYSSYIYIVQRVSSVCRTWGKLDERLGEKLGERRGEDWRRCGEDVEKMWGRLERGGENVEKIFERRLAIVFY